MTSPVHREFQSVLNHTVRDITSRFAGIQLREEEAALSGDICTVHTVLEGSHRAAVLLCADTPLLVRLAQNILHSQAVSRKDVEDVATEYFNIICGRIAAGLFQTAHISSRFQSPRFHAGRYLPEEESPCRFELNFTGGDNGSLRLIYMALLPPHEAGH